MKSWWYLCLGGEPYHSSLTASEWGAGQPHYSGCWWSPDSVLGVLWPPAWRLVAAGRLLIWGCDHAASPHGLHKVGVGGLTAAHYVPLAVVVQLLSCVWLLVTPWTAPPGFLSLTISWSLLKLIHWVGDATQPSYPLSSPSPPSLSLSSTRVFSSESALHSRWPKYWSFSFSISFQWICRVYWQLWFTTAPYSAFSAITLVEEFGHLLTDQEDGHLSSPLGLCWYGWSGPEFD